MEKITTFIICLCLGFSVQAQVTIVEEPPKRKNPIMYYEVKRFQNPIWVSVKPSMYKKHAIDVIMEHDSLRNCPQTLRKWETHLLSPECYPHAMLSAPIRRWAERIDSTFAERIRGAVYDSAYDNYYKPPYVREDGIHCKNLVYCTIPCSDFLIVYVTVDAYLYYNDAMLIDYRCPNPYNFTEDNSMFYQNDKKRHGLFLKFAIPLAPEHVRE